MKLAIIGTGGIVKEALLALREVPAIETVAIYGRPHSQAKAEELAAGHGIAAVYTDYAQLLTESGADFVYIGLVNSAHYAYAREALLAGRNVIVEKPFTSTSEEAEELAELACSRQLYLFEAVTSLHLPNFRALKEMLPQLGQIRAVQANYSQYSSRYDRYLRQDVAPAFDPRCSGGALYDINIYNLNLIVGLFGSPEAVSYTPVFGFNGIDTSGVAVLAYPGFFATSVGAKDSESPSFFLVQGEKGWLRVEGAPNELPAFTVHAGGRELTVADNRYGHRMVHEFEEFARVFAAGDRATMEEWLETSQQVLATAEQARLKAGIVFPVDAD